MPYRHKILKSFLDELNLLGRVPVQGHAHISREGFLPDVEPAISKASSHDHNASKATPQTNKFIRSIISKEGFDCPSLIDYMALHG